MKKQTKRMAQSGALFAAFCMVPFSQVATAEVSISGWINEGLTYYDDGDASDIVQSTDNGNTLANRITFAGSNEVASGVTAGFEVITEPRRDAHPLITANQDNFDNDPGYTLGILGTSLNVGGSWGKITVGLQSMPTDNIAVLEDPSLTLWSGISPIFRGNGFFIRGAADDGTVEVLDGGVSLATPFTIDVDEANRINGLATTVERTAALVAVSGDAAADGLASTATPTTPTVVGAVLNRVLWGDFLNCFTEPGLRGFGGIGIDCNGIYRNGIRYDLPALGPVSIALGAANDDIYDVSAKYKGQMGRLNAQLALGYAINQGVNEQRYDEAENFQLQAGLMDSVTGIFGTVAYQYEEADLLAGVNTNVSDESDAWWIKVGIKRQFTTLGDTSIAFDYGLYNDQYSYRAADVGVTGSEVQRIGVSVDQYFGDGLIIYGKWENLELDVDGSSIARSLYNGGQELDTFTLGFTYFF